MCIAIVIVVVVAARRASALLVDGALARPPTGRLSVARRASATRPQARRPSSRRPRRRRRPSVEATDEAASACRRGPRVDRSGGVAVPGAARGDRRRVRAGRRRGARRHPAAVLQPGDPRRDRPRPRRLRRRGARLPLAAQGRGGFGGKVDVGKLADIQRRHRRSKKPFYVAAGPDVHRRLPEGRPRRRPKKVVHARRSSPGMEAGYRRAVPEVRAPRLPRAVVPDVAVVRVPVPRLAVQPGRREEGWPGAPWPRPLRARGVGRQHRRRHRQPRPRSADRHRTPPVRARKGRSVSDVHRPTTARPGAQPA